VVQELHKWTPPPPKLTEEPPDEDDAEEPTASLVRVDTTDPWS
jgi:hypothetical protein